MFNDSWNFGDSQGIIEGFFKYVYYGICYF